MVKRMVAGARNRARILATPMLGALLVAGVHAAHAGASPEREPRVETLLRKMTLEEKLGQLTQQWGGDVQQANPGAAQDKVAEIHAVIRAGKVGSFLGVHGAEHANRLQKLAVEQSRLGVPLIFGNDVIHGYRTIFPIPLGQAGSWDPALIEKSASVAAEEASAAGTHWSFGPMVDVARDPRWGRIAEGFGEDPYLSSVMAAAKVRGFQGGDLAAPDTILACAKHFVAYGGAEGGRDYNTVDISEHTLRSVYLPPFRAAVRAGAGTLMSAFNEISGIPASANRHTLTRILRQEWGFNGFVVSDWNSIGELVVHGFAADRAEAARLAISAGVDMDMCSFVYREELPELVRAGKISEQDINRAVRRVLRMKFKLGLFERPYADPQRERTVMLSKPHRALAREAARKSIVLLKNDDALLPLSDAIGSLAVIGPLADNRQAPLGTWCAVGDAKDVVTVLEGIRGRVSADTRVSYAQGCDIDGDSADGIAEAGKIAKQADVAVLVIGEDDAMSGEGHCRSALDLPPIQQKLIQAVQATGVPVVAVLMNGRPLSIVWTAENVPAIVETWHLGVECGHAVADVLFGDVNPGGKLPVTFPRRVGQVPIYYNHKNTGRPAGEGRYTSKYIDLPSTPLFPFGYGLSYTTFEYENLTVHPRRIGPCGRVEVGVDVKNVGDRDGDEVVQVYIRDVAASVTRPVKELKGFRRVTLKPGEQTRLVFTLSPEQLGFYNRQMEYVVEPGTFRVWVGPNSTEGLQAEFEVVKD